MYTAEVEQKSLVELGGCENKGSLMTLPFRNPLNLKAKLEVNSGFGLSLKGKAQTASGAAFLL